MNPRRPSPNPGDQGLTLLELLIYMSMVSIIALTAFSALGRLWTAAGQMSAETQDQSIALQAAELWRIDVRGATSRVELDAEGKTCRMLHGTNSVTWSFRDGVLQRQVQGRPPVFWVGRIARGAFSFDARPHATALRCDLLLTPRSVKARQAPALTFAAVPRLNPALMMP